MKGAVAVIAGEGQQSSLSSPRSRFSGSSSSKPRSLPVVADSPSSPYAPGALRVATDGERERVEALCAQYPEFARLGYEPLLQIAETYLDDADHALRAELPMGAAGYRRHDEDDVNPAWSDERGCCSPQFLLFAVGVVVLGVGLALPRVNPTMEVVSTAFIVIGAGMIGAAFEVGSRT